MSTLWGTPMNSWQLSSGRSKELQELLAANFVPSPCRSWIFPWFFGGWKVGWLGLVTSVESWFEVLDNDDKKGTGKDAWFTLSSILMQFESIQTWNKTLIITTAIQNNIIDAPKTDRHESMFACHILFMSSSASFSNFPSGFRWSTSEIQRSLKPPLPWPPKPPVM